MTLVQQVAHDSGFWNTLNALANVFIVIGYIVVPFTVLRFLPLTPSVRAAGTLFFATCALTHLSMAFDFEHTRWMVINHTIQAVAVGWFVLGFYLLLRDALRRAEARRREDG